MKRYRFKAIVQRSTGWGAFVLFPHDAAKEFGTKGRVPVRVLFGGITHTGSLMPHGGGFHRLAVPQAIREQLGIAPGELIEVSLWKDEEVRGVDLPQDFTRMLSKEKLLTAFQSLSISRRKEYRNWINSAKREETRHRRLVKALQWLRDEVSA